jgi:DNA polymerase III subunit alpha
VIDRSERRTKTGNKMGVVQLSDQSGHFEAVIFSEGLQRHRELLEPGRAVILRLSAALDGEDIRARIEDAEPLDQAMARQKQDVRVFLRDASALGHLATRLKERGESRVSMILILDNGQQEVEVELPGRFAVTPQVASSLRAMPGIESVELV